MCLRGICFSCREQRRRKTSIPVIHQMPSFDAWKTLCITRKVIHYYFFFFLNVRKIRINKILGQHSVSSTKRTKGDQKITCASSLYIYKKKKRNIEGAESKGTADRESKIGGLRGGGGRGGKGRGNGGRQDEILRLHYTRMASSSSRIYKSDCISRLRNTHIYNIQIIAIIYAVHRAYRGSITHVCRLKYRRETRVAEEAVTVSFRIKYRGMEWSLKIKLIARSIVVVCVCAG